MRNVKKRPPEGFGKKLGGIALNYVGFEAGQRLLLRCRADFGLRITDLKSEEKKCQGNQRTDDRSRGRRSAVDKRGNVGARGGRP